MYADVSISKRRIFLGGFCKVCNVQCTSITLKKKQIVQSISGFRNIRTLEVFHFFSYLEYWARFTVVLKSFSSKKVTAFAIINCRCCLRNTGNFEVERQEVNATVRTNHCLLLPQIKTPNWCEKMYLVWKSDTAVVKMHFCDGI